MFERRDTASTRFRLIVNPVKKKLDKIEGAKAEN